MRYFSVSHLFSHIALPLYTSHLWEPTFVSVLFLLLACHRVPYPVEQNKSQSQGLPHVGSLLIEVAAYQLVHHATVFQVSAVYGVAQVYVLDPTTIVFDDDRFYPELRLSANAKNGSVYADCFTCRLRLCRALCNGEVYVEFVSHKLRRLLYNIYVFQFNYHPYILYGEKEYKKKKAFESKAYFTLFCILQLIIADIF